MAEGRHRHPAAMRLTGITGLAVALGATGAMLSIGPAKPPAPVSSGPLTLAESYPDSKVIQVAARASDGATYIPVFFVSANLVVGTAPGPKATVRLLLHNLADKTERELRRLPDAQAPEFGGFATDGKVLVWLELTAGATGAGEGRIWAADLSGGPARIVTADTGDVVLFDKASDISMHDGKLSWVAALPTTPPKTEVRTVPIGGGKVGVSVFEGAYAIATWPWLSTVDVSGNAEPVELFNLATRDRVTVGVQPGEQVACSPSWCRSVLIGETAASTVIELMPPSKGSRMRTISGAVAPVLADVAVLDRFEIYSRSTDGTSVPELLLFDMSNGKTVLVTKNDDLRVCRNGFLWWSTGDNETLTWHALDLASLK